MARRIGESLPPATSLSSWTSTILFMFIILWLSSIDCCLQNGALSVEHDFRSWQYLNWSYKTRLSLKIGWRFIIICLYIYNDKESSMIDKWVLHRKQGTFKQVPLEPDAATVTKGVCFSWLLLLIHIKINQIKHSEIYIKENINC